MKIVLKNEIFNRIFVNTFHSAVATGEPGELAPITAACASPFWLTKNTFFGTSRNN